MIKYKDEYLEKVFKLDTGCLSRESFRLLPEVQALLTIIRELPEVVELAAKGFTDKDRIFTAPLDVRPKFVAEKRYARPRPRTNKERAAVVHSMKNEYRTICNRATTWGEIVYSPDNGKVTCKTCLNLLRVK